MQALIIKILCDNVSRFGTSSTAFIWYDPEQSWWMNKHILQLLSDMDILVVMVEAIVGDLQPTHYSH